MYGKLVSRARMSHKKENRMQHLLHELSDFDTPSITNVVVTYPASPGCLGLISNGPSRDLDEIRPMHFQYMLTGVTPGHGAMAVQAVNVPVSVAGMDVAPGEIIHMDENGAVKFPADKLEAVLQNAREL